MSANDKQVGGTHYQGEIQHWDYAWSHKFDLFQYIITKWIERWRDKGGIEDLKKARHAIDKYIEIAEAEQAKIQGIKAGAVIAKCGKCGEKYNYAERALSRRDNKSYICSSCGTAEAMKDLGLDPGPEYVDQ